MLRKRSMRAILATEAASKSMRLLAAMNVDSATAQLAIPEVAAAKHAFNRQPQSLVPPRALWLPQSGKSPSPGLAIECGPKCRTEPTTTR